MCHLPQSILWCNGSHYSSYLTAFVEHREIVECAGHELAAVVTILSILTHGSPGPPSSQGKVQMCSEMQALKCHSVKLHP